MMPERPVFIGTGLATKRYRIYYSQISTKLGVAIRQALALSIYHRIARLHMIEVLDTHDFEIDDDA